MLFAVCKLPVITERTLGAPAVDRKKYPRSLPPRPSYAVLGRRSLVPFLIALLFASLAQAQPVQPLSFIVKYYVWGQVKAPGSYQLSANPDLVELLSAAGGPASGADVRHIILVHAITQTQTRIDLKKVLAAGQVVQLSPSDIVIVPNSPWYAIGTVFSVATTVLTLATLVVSVMTWMKTS